jgi:hypothetical protein
MRLQALIFARPAQISVKISFTRKNLRGGLARQMLPICRFLTSADPIQGRPGQIFSREAAP